LIAKRPCLVVSVEEAVFRFVANTPLLNGKRSIFCKSQPYHLALCIKSVEVDMSNNSQRRRRREEC
jgi:hypothetical protein